jgi:hypothetical protein
VHEPGNTTARSESSAGRGPRSDSGMTTTTALRARNAGVDVMQIQRVLARNPELGNVVSVRCIDSVTDPDRGADKLGVVDVESCLPLRHPSTRLISHKIHPRVHDNDYIIATITYIAARPARGHFPSQHIKISNMCINKRLTRPVSLKSPPRACPTEDKLSSHVMLTADCRVDIQVYV